jgi:AcrR family transcriptional regulator
LNYYFRSKEKLFEQVMMEKMGQFMGIMGAVLNDPETGLEQKVQKLAESYINMLSKNPDLPVFVLSEIRNHPKKLFQLMEHRTNLSHSVFMKQIEANAGQQKMNPLHFLMNILGLMVFPFAGRPLLTQLGPLGDEEFDALMQERKKLIPVWVHRMFKNEPSDEKSNSI